jgi:hypothetical protein
MRASPKDGFDERGQQIEIVFLLRIKIPTSHRINDGEHVAITT